ncbi:hypothetical protein SALB1_3520 [Salinisphaera sp. LB1]|nr:hypothetical protein SALB1_3520 [Salinisphaera sp. LB1]
MHYRARRPPSAMVGRAHRLVASGHYSVARHGMNGILGNAGARRSGCAARPQSFTARTTQGQTPGYSPDTRTPRDGRTKRGAAIPKYLKDRKADADNRLWRGFFRSIVPCSVSRRRAAFRRRVRAIGQGISIHYR